MNKYLDAKLWLSITYLIKSPLRALSITFLYKNLKGRYRMTTILAHALRESTYETLYNRGRDFSADRKDTVNHKQLIINIHDGLLHSGGLTDRLKGMCTLYSYSKKGNYDFKIYFVFPFLLEKYLSANSYDWTIDKGSLSYNLKTTAIYLG